MGVYQSQTGANGTKNIHFHWPNRHAPPPAKPPATYTVNSRTRHRRPFSGRLFTAGEKSTETVKK
uniref:Uncharacterized protein n=1 Tax=Triticum urartu TaxID=4572 RepID=A0A8R7TVI1_TRIUA